jgi:hypothetical protein
MQSRAVRVVLSMAMGAGLFAAPIAGANEDTRVIQATAQAAEEKARFDALALRFVERYEATGYVHFSDQAARMTAKGEAQEAKFLAKVDRFAAQDAAQAARQAAHDAAAAARTDNGLHLAKGKNR